jgi:hypothetical protein
VADLAAVALDVLQIPGSRRGMMAETARSAARAARPRMTTRRRLIARLRVIARLISRARPRGTRLA